MHKANRLTDGALTNRGICQPAFAACAGDGTCGSQTSWPTLLGCEQSGLNDFSCVRHSQLTAGITEGGYAAIDEQLFWHLRQHLTHCSMPPTCSQLSAQALQISAQALQYRAWCALLRLMKSTHAAQAAMQSSISFTCVCSTWAPPSERQWLVNIPAQITWHSWQFSRHCFMDAVAVLICSSPYVNLVAAQLP